MANHQIPLVEEFGVSKTLLSQIANSPYFKKFDSTVFSKILFKPGYPLQSVELIELQDILQEQIRRFGNHIFKDGSVVTSAGGLDVADCVLYELQDGADETVTIGETDLIAFVDATNSTELLKARFIDFRSARIVDGVVQPTMIGVVFNNGLTQNAITTGNAVQVYVQNVAGTNTTLIGTLNSTTTREGKYANIKNNIFYISGYFTNINEQNHIFAVDNLSTMDVEVGVELTWRIVDITDDDYKEQLFDPAQNSLNDNTPGADRLILQLELTDHELNYTQQETDWKFIPLLKYDNGNIIFRSKYPFYSVLGDTLARRTYEINGNFVVDNFKLEVRSDLFLDGTHTLTQNEIVGTENIYTIEGSDSNYFDLVVGNYIMFGSAIDYNRLLLIKEIESATKIKVSDIHYDDYEDTGDPELLSPSKVGSTILLRDEEKLNYVLTEGKAYVKGYRFETTFTTRLKDNKARTFTTQESSVLPNQNYFEIENFVHTEDQIFFDRLEEVDLHCIENSMLYSMNLTLNGFATPLTISAGHRIQVGTNGAIFESIDGNSIYRLISYTKNNNVGLPTTAGGPYIITNLTTNTVNPNTYNLVSITALGETPYRRDQTENYSSKVLTGNQPVTASVSGPSVQFTATGGSFTANFSNGDLVIIKDETTLDEFYGYIDTINASSLATILTFPSLMNLSNDFTITKPSYQAYYNYQYNSTKIGTVRSNSVGVEFPNRFRFSHFNLINTPKQFRAANFGTNQIKTISLELSTIDDVYNGMYIEYNGSLWNISDYDGGTQTFTLDNVSLTNPFNFTVGSQLNLIYNRNNIRSLVKSTYINGKEFYADIVRNSVDEPSIKQPNQTQKKFSRLLLEGSGEVKSVNVDDYSIFYQDQWVVSGGNTSTISKNIGNTFQEDFNIDNDNVKVYAADVIYDTLGTGNILYSKGENIPISSANIVDYVLTINFNNIFVNNDAFIVHANIPVNQPIPRLKTLTTTTDTFQVAIEVANRKLVIDNNRYYGGVPPIFELKHSDIYRIRRVSVGAGKTTSLIDLTNYFDLDTGQRDTHYDYGRIVLKPYLNLPSIASLNTTNAFYYFEVEYDYFDSTTGHYFTVNSYQDIHYRKIPTYIDAIKEKFPLRNVIDFRPVRQPKGSLYDFEQETDIVSQVNYDYDYYLNEDKVISIEGNGSSDIALQYETADNYQSTDYGIKLYDLEIPAYTFSFEDVEYKMIDNRNFTMKDISKLQKRIENLEDIVQLNALELQALQTNLTDSNGDPRYTNGLLVDMFSGFAIAKVDEDGFGASIDIKNMKMFPSFDMHNIQLKPSPSAIVTSSYPSVRNNIIMLPIDSHSLINDTIDTTTNTTKSTDLALHNGKLTLHPFSDTWFSESTKPDLLLNEDNQFKNWRELPVDKAFETQWNIWEQFWSGEQIDQNVPTLANATLAQKTGQMVNNKNNIEKIINDKKINTTLSLLNREIRVGFVLEVLDAYTDTYEIYVNGNLTVFNQGQRLEIDVSTSTSVATFLNKFLNFEITQNTSTSSAVGTIRNIQYVSTTGGNNKYYIYVTNVTNDLFVVGSLTNLTGTVSAVQTFNTLTLDNQNKLCGDIVLDEGDYPTDTALDIQIRKLGGSQITVASNSFYLGGLLQNRTSFSQSVRPVQRKLFSNDENIYIDDKTYSINSTTRIVNPFHQPFIFDQSFFISKLVVRCKNPSANVRKMIFTIQPMITDNLSPSLVLPFSEKIINVPASHDGNITIEFDVPIFIPSNSEYAFVFRTENDVQLYTKIESNNTILIDNCIAARNTSGTANEILQIQIYRAVFNTNEKQIPLYLKDSNANVLVDRYRLNLNTLQLTDTYSDFEWRARNYDSSVKDIAYKTISPNRTTSVEKRKVFTPTDFDLLCKLRSNDNRYSPILDLERLSITTIEHHINNGSMLANNIIQSRNSGATADANLVQLTLSQDGVLGLYPDKVCKIDMRSDGTIANFYSDSNFLMYSNDFDVAIQKANTSTGVFENYPYTITTTTTADTATFVGPNLNINLDISSEFSANSQGNALYRYFSPVVTLGDDFEAMQLYVQMDAVLKNVNEVFVYYRVLENTSPFNSFSAQSYKLMKILTIDVDKYSSSSLAKTLEFESQRLSTDPRFKHFQVKICFTSSNFIDVPTVENVRILALDN